MGNHFEIKLTIKNMLRKFLASLGIVAIITMLVPMTAVAADGDVDITSVTPASYDVFSGNATINFTTADGDLTLEVLSGSTPVKTLINNVAYTAGSYSVTWDGKDTAGYYVINGSYTIQATLAGANADTDTATLTVSSAIPLSVIVTPTSFDPYEDDEGLVVSYSTVPTTADSVSLSIVNSYGENVFTDSISSPGTSGNFDAWDGKNSGDYVAPGELKYTAIVTAKKSGFTDGVNNTDFTVSYDNADAPEVSIDSDLDSFDPDFDYAMLIVTVGDAEADINVEIRDKDGDLIGEYDEISSYGDEELLYTFDGKDEDGDNLALGAYEIIVVATNNYGAATDSIEVELNDDEGTIPTSNLDIGGIDFDSTFKPDKDETLVIQFDVKRPLDDLAVYAIRGDVESEIWSDSNVDEENNVEIEWDGSIDDDDEEFAEEGKWRIEFRSTAEDSNTELLAADYTTISYEEPTITDMILSKTSIDPDQDETLYIMFKVDTAALVDVYAYESGDEDDEIEEDLEVEEDTWYAVEWDGNGYDENDDVEIYVFARSINNEDVYDSESKDVTIEEDDVSGDKVNITQDSIMPVLAESGDGFEFSYNIDDDADVTITVYKGTSSSGDDIQTVIDEQAQDAGDNTVEWNGEDDNEDPLKESQEFYSYKIEASNSSGKDTEKGVFIVGDSVDFSDGDDDNSDDDDDSGNVSEEDCSGFSDVSKSSKYCDAITWANDEGIFVGYSDGTFKPYSSINRMEMLKVLLESNEINLMASGNLNYGFNDVIPGAWYMPYLGTAKTLGIFSGDAGGKTARPGDSVNRAESLKLMFETLRVASGYHVPSCPYSSYTDVPSGVWYANYVCASDEYNLFETYGTLFSPSSFASRGEIAQALYNLNKAGL